MRTFVLCILWAMRDLRMKLAQITLVTLTEYKISSRQSRKRKAPQRTIAYNVSESLISNPIHVFASKRDECSLQKLVEVLTSYKNTTKILDVP